MIERLGDGFRLIEGRPMAIRTVPKVYLGDAVYAEYDGYHLKLTTEDGFSSTNTIYLEPEVLHALEVYIRTVHNGY